MTLTHNGAPLEPFYGEEEATHTPLGWKPEGAPAPTFSNRDYQQALALDHASTEITSRLQSGGFTEKIPAPTSMPPLNQPPRSVAHQTGLVPGEV